MSTNWKIYDRCRKCGAAAEQPCRTYWGGPERTAPYDDAHDGRPLTLATVGLVVDAITRTKEV
jgi:hypothetical protein